MTIRLDPKLRYLTELAARQQRRTASSFIEWAIERALNGIILREEIFTPHGDTVKTTLSQEAEKLWDTDEPDRVAKLALYYPELLTYDEQVLWKLIKECGYLWTGRYEKGVWEWDIEQDALIFHRLRKHWETFKQVAAGEADKSQLPRKEDDDDIPF